MYMLCCHQTKMRCRQCMKKLCAAIDSTAVWHFSIERIVFLARLKYNQLFYHFVIFIMLTCECNHSLQQYQGLRFISEFLTGIHVFAAVLLQHREGRIIVE